jgi:hypothetical protein
MVFPDDKYLEPDKTNVLYGNDNIIKETLETILWVKKSIVGSVDKAGPAIHVLYEPIWSRLVSLKKDVKIRSVTEITVDNVTYCKKLLEVCDLRHLDGVRTNFGIDDGKELDSHDNCERQHDECER